MSPQERKHERVIDCLTQLESLNLERPEGMTIPRRTDEIIRKIPRSSQASSATSPAARRKAVQYHEDIGELIELHREFSRSNQKLWKKVTRAVHLISALCVRTAKNRPSEPETRDPSLHDQISSAFNTHQEQERQRLQQVKSAFQLLKESGDNKGRIKKSKMNAILASLGVEKILEVAKKKHTNTNYTMSIMDRVNLCADYWLEKAKSETQMVDFNFIPSTDADAGNADAATAATAATAAGTGTTTDDGLSMMMMMMLNGV